MRFLGIAACALLLTGCVTSHKTYRAPDSAKVERSTKILTEKVALARETARKARVATLEAQESARKLMALGVDLKGKLAILKEKVPVAMVPMVTEIQTAAVAQDDEEKILRAKLDEAVSLNAILQDRQIDEEKARAQLQNDQGAYVTGAVALAQSATNEREFRIKAESQLLKQKLWGILWKLGGGAVVIGIIALIILWFTGKLAFKFAK